MEYKPDFASGALHNWVEKLDLPCEKSSKIGLLGSAYFIGWVCTLLVLPRLADTYGRKWIYRLGMILTGACLSCVYVSSSINSMIAIIFCIGVLTSVRITISYVYLNEFILSKYQAYVGTIWGIFDSMVFLMTTIYFDHISKFWIPITTIGLF